MSNFISKKSSQLTQLRELLEFLLQNNEFYKSKLKSVRSIKEVENLDQFSKLIPFTTKQELVNDQLAYPPFGSNLSYHITNYSRYSQTSGTTSRPIRWLDTNESWSSMINEWVNFFMSVSISSNDCILFPFSFGPFLGFWTSFEAALKLGCLCLPGGGMSTHARLQMILDNNVTVICCTPTYALYLAEVARLENINLNNTKVRYLIVAGEPGGNISTTRRRIEEYWPSACVLDHYGMTEVGPVSFECPTHSGLHHINESSFFPEIIDLKSEKSAQPGEVGELVLTTLKRWGTPLLRYRTGDLVSQKINCSCDCGNHGLSLDRGILGRADEMLIIRGVNLFPSAIEEVIRGYKDVAEYQVEIKEKTLKEICILIEPISNCTNINALRVSIETELKTTFLLRISVKVVEPGTLPRFEFKAKRWIRI